MLGCLCVDRGLELERDQKAILTSPSVTKKVNLILLDLGFKGSVLGLYIPQQVEGCPIS